MNYIAENTEFKLHNSAVSLGKFDGVHIGHKLLLDKIIDYKSEGYTSVVFTFNYHPYNLFAKKEIDLIDTEEEKVKKFEDMGIDALISYPFTKETASMEPEDFIRKVLIEKLDAKIIVVGSDFCFGHNRSGNVDLLRKKSLRYGYQLIVYDKLKDHEEIVSSSLIRLELKKGNIEYANELLMKPYSIIGEVVHGRKLGRTLLMPTLNQVPSEHKLLPPNGVYASKTIVDGVSYNGVTNIGYKPTVTGEKIKGVETYLFEFDRTIYGKIIEVELYKFIRSEKKFDSLEELKKQMGLDALFAMNYF